MKAKGKTKSKPIKLEQLTDFTDDWPVDKLREAIKKGDKSEASNITSAKEHRAFYA